ncbi:Aste57867_12135 [Aphanomyces stellatus]|uniref:Aste57867_12135 protein n=1 Tax=Aphanomyces stellatus TaxID=120398 RepID=A0A485KV71_9STRA|nr:hypothetical protein As57867_012090 [Aphanomyces stellatus]VFT88989.1 Aste57867_12135 [Aphanomyces stellatus]
MEENASCNDERSNAVEERLEKLERQVLQLPELICVAMGGQARRRSTEVESTLKTMHQRMDALEKRIGGIPAALALAIKTPVAKSPSPPSPLLDEFHQLSSALNVFSNAVYASHLPTHSHAASTIPASTPSTWTSYTCFTWSDGSMRRAPETWRFPSTTCSVLWQLWFHGDPAAGICPFRLLTGSDVPPCAQTNWTCAKGIMDVLVKAAGASVAAIAAMPPPASMSLFDAAFEKWWTRELASLDVEGIEDAKSIMYPALHALSSASVAETPSLLPPAKRRCLPRSSHED